jgi:ABC-type uncharacterized transport system involved in gliding motility auxiliary subunit
LRDYVKGGGKALVMVEPAFQEAQENLTGLLAGWSIEAGKDVVVDVSGMGQIFGANELAPLAMDYPYHAITKDFRLMTLFGGARSMQAREESVDGVTAQNLVRTSGQSWAESDVQLRGSITLDERSGDRTGPISLAAVATVRGPETTPTPSPAAEEAGDDAAEEDVSKDAEEAKAPEGRVVAVGDVDFASNSLLGFQGNQDFFLNVVAWLAEDVDLISIRPKEPEDQSLFLSRTVQQNVSLVALAVLPLVFVIGGIVTWWRRR